MAIFKELNFNSNKDREKITVKHLYTARDHLGDKAEILKFLTEIRLTRLIAEEDQRPDMDWETLDILSSYLKPFSRISEVRFYREPKKHHFIVLLISNLPTFKPTKLLKRKMVVEEKEGFKFTLIDTPKSEEEKLKTVIPKSWELDSELTKRYQRRRIVFND